ncbi:MAG: CoxF protein [Bauldia sp.]|nr:CoxF protein [Bauldia sp.]
MTAGTDVSTNGSRGPDGLTDDERRRRKGRSLALGIALGAFVILLFILAWVKGPGVIAS